MRKTPAQEHRELVDYAVGEYRATFVLCLGWLFQGGEIPGLELVSDKGLRAFFENTDPQYWQHLVETDPAEAMSQLAQWPEDAHAA